MARASKSKSLVDDTGKVDSAIKSAKDESEKVIKIAEMHKWFGDFHVLKNINLEVSKG